MKYKKCPRCELNYVTEDKTLCQVCQDEIDGKKSIFDTDTFDSLLCPYCQRNVMGADDVMCYACLRKRNKKLSET